MIPERVESHIDPLPEIDYPLACKIQFQMIYQVNWRLNPENVIKNLMMTFQQFAISNREGYIVYSTTAAIFYMKLSIFGDSAVQNANREGGVLLRVYGVAVPGDEIVVGFVNMVEAKIKSTEN
jgi:hypothetical protein